MAYINKLQNQQEYSVHVVNCSEQSNIARGPCPSHSGRCRRDFGDGHGATKKTNNTTEYLFRHRIARTMHHSKGIYKG